MKTLDDRTEGREPARVTGALVTIDYFRVLSTPPLMGRAFDRGTDAGTTGTACGSQFPDLA